MNVNAITKVTQVFKDFNNYLNKDLVIVENKFIFDSEELARLEREFVNAYNKHNANKDEFLAIVYRIKDLAPNSDFLKFRSAYGV